MLFMHFGYQISFDINSKGIIIIIYSKDIIIKLIRSEKLKGWFLIIVNVEITSLVLVGSESLECKAVGTFAVSVAFFMQTPIICLSQIIHPIRITCAVADHDFPKQPLQKPSLMFSVDPMT